MNIALIGYGRMGKTIEQLATAAGHQIVLKIDIENETELDSLLNNRVAIDVAIEFSIPSVAFRNIMKCITNRIPVVSGTTGWLDQFDEVIEQVKARKGAFFYSSNYSIGVNLFFEVNRQLAKMINGYADYQVSIEETHHVHKLDAPSGTAITLANHLISQLDNKFGWAMQDSASSNDISIASFREREVPGIHSTLFENDADVITIRHEAKNRMGFAQGALKAAEFIVDKQGVFGMADLMGFQNA